MFFLTICSIWVNPRTYKSGVITYCLVRGESDTYYHQFATEFNEILGTDYYRLINIVANNSFVFLVKNCIFIVYSFDINGDPLSQGSGFLLKNYGILTNAHNFDENWASFKVVDVEGAVVKTIYRDISDIIINRIIDYAFIPCTKLINKSIGWALCNSPQYSVNTHIKKIGFPQYSDGDSPNVISDAVITGSKSDRGGYYTISSQIVHGESGGIVVNANDEVIGIIRIGSIGYNLSVYDSPPGFIPINRVIEDMHSQGYNVIIDNIDKIK